MCLAHAGGCEEDDYLGYTWPETILGSYATSTCPQCKEVLGSLAGSILRYCDGTSSQGANWSDVLDFTNCATSKSNITTRLCDIAMVKYHDNSSPIIIQFQNVYCFSLVVYTLFTLTHLIV